MKRLIYFFLFFGFCLPLMAQSECHYYHRKACESKDNEPMKYDSQSKSAALAKGQISEFHMVAYGGLDYRISICSQENLGDQLQLKIYEKDRVLVKPEEAVNKDVYEDEQISNEEEDSYADETYEEYTSDADYTDSYSTEESYDDSYDPYGSEGVGTHDEPKFKLVKELLYDNANDEYSRQIEFTADNTMSLILEVHVPGDPAKGKLKIREMGCVGVLVEHTKTRTAGFH